MKTPKKMKPPKQINDKSLYIEVSSRTTDSYREPERFGSWSETNVSSVGKVSKSIEGLSRWNFSEFKVPDEVYNSPTVYIVYVIYSSGDSFGSSSGNIAIAFVTENVEEAQQVQKAI